MLSVVTALVHSVAIRISTLLLRYSDLLCHEVSNGSRKIVSEQVAAGAAQRRNEADRVAG
jgi:hypothetical protein